MNQNDIYFSGGFAEIVTNPSSITLSYLNKWFNTKSSLGRACDILNIPYSISDRDLLTTDNSGTLLVDLFSEQEMLYKNTILSYKQQSDINKKPSQYINLKKTINLKNLFNTFKIIYFQSTIISSPDKIIANSKRFLDKIPLSSTAKNIDEANAVIENQVMPYLIAIAIYSQFYLEYLLYKNKTSSANLLSNINTNDPKTNALKDMIRVKNKQLLFSEFIENYALFSDNDYELECPRWYEIPEQIHNRIENLTQSTVLNFNNNQFSLTKQQKIASSLIELRMQSRLKALPHINTLRKTLIEKNLISHVKNTVQQNQNSIITKHASKGKGIAISSGIANGQVIHISHPNHIIPSGSICIIPNMSPQFSHLYPQCSGIIFKTGGLTSHGAIIAREFKIPAAIDNSASFLMEGSQLRIDGSSGEWKQI